MSPHTPFDVPWALLIAGAIVGQWASYDPRRGWPVLAALIGSVALYYLVALSRRPVVVDRAATTIGLAAAVYFLAQYQHIAQVEKSGLASAVGRVTSGPFPQWGRWQPNTNSVAALLAGLIPLAVAVAAVGPSWPWRAFGGLAAGLMGMAVLATASRGAWVALVAAGSLWLAFRWRWGVAVLLAAAVVTAAVLGGYLYFVRGATLEQVPVLGSVLYQLFARPDRLEVYAGSLRLIQDYAFTGIGLGDVFGRIYSQYVLLIPHVFLTYSHNLYLTIWLGHGLLGIIGVGWLIATFAGVVVREKQERRPSPWFEAGWTGVVVILVHGLFDARQYVDLWTMWPLFALLGLLVAARSQAVPVRRTVRLRRWHWVALGILVASCALAWRPLVAQAWANFGAVRQAEGELADLPEKERHVHRVGAQVAYTRALELDAGNRTANLRLGNLDVARGQYEAGIEHLETVWRAAPQDPTARKALGLAYVWVGEVDRAAELLAGSKDIVAELNTWGWWHSQEGRHQEATYAYRASLALMPDQPQVRDLLAGYTDKGR